MPVSILLLCILTAVPSLDASPPPRGSLYINCGSTQEEETINGIKWVPDDTFIKTGNVSQINTPGILHLLSTVRHFPDTSARKYCFEIDNLIRNKRYLIRTTYYYGGFDGGKQPPVFDQIIDGTRWSTVDTTENFAKGLTSYYEIITQVTRNLITFCLARNSQTASDPFISALEMISLDDSMYNATDFQRDALSTVARHRFGHSEFMSYPDDPFNRYWMPFTDQTTLTVDCQSNISSTELWNNPPEAALSKGFTASKGKELSLNWPAMSLPAASYYVALYFQDNRSPSSRSWRVFDVRLNNQPFYDGLNVTTNGVMVYGKQWPLSGQTEIRMIPAPSSDKGPIINAGEILQSVPLGPKTFPREAVAMWKLANGFQNPPSDWVGDPCLPLGNSWTGVTCAVGKANFYRVISLNLANLGISGNLPKVIARLRGIQSIDLSNNKLSGPIPDLTPLNALKFLNLQNNQFEGQVPDALKNKPGIDVRYFPGPESRLVSDTTPADYLPQD